MINSIKIFNETNSRIPRSKINLIYKKELQKKDSLNLIFINNVLSKKLNTEYRKKKYPTNILTFPSIDNLPAEIYINTEITKKDAENNSIPFSKHLLFLFIHGALHIMGYKHGNLMEKKEDELYKKYV